MLPLTRSLALALCTAATLAAAPIVPLSYTINIPGGYPDEGGTQLTDGLHNAIIPGDPVHGGGSLGSDPWPAYPYGAYNWVGWDGGSPKIDFDFGSNVTIGSVTIDFALWTGAAVYLPGKATINGQDFAISTDGYTGYTNFNRVTLTFNGNWTGSNLVLDLTQVPERNRWMFVDEVTFNTTVTSSPVPDSGNMLALLGVALTGFAAFRRRHAG